MNALLQQWAAYPAAFFIAATFGILLTGVFKGGFGGGPGGIAVALMSMFISPANAAGIVLPILCVMDIFGVLAYRGNWSREHMKILIPGALVGITLGALAFGTVPVNWVRLFIGVIAVTFTLNRWFGIAQRLDKTIFVGTTVIFFTVVNYVKLVPFFFLGQLSADNLGLSLLFAPLAPLGIWLGLRLERWIPEKPFYRVSYTILFGTGCKLIYDALTA